MLAVKNCLELGVRAEVGRRKSEAEKTRAGCWCSVCEADVSALALTTLPPRYCLEQSFLMAQERTMPGRVATAVQQAMVRVIARPKHRPGIPSYYPQRIRVVNFAMEEGSALVRSVMVNSSAPCLCVQCLADTLAFALNRFPPLYGVECDGTLKFPPDRREFFRHDLILVLEQAARAVALHPHH